MPEKETSGRADMCGVTCFSLQSADEAKKEEKDADTEYELWWPPHGCNVAKEVQNPEHVVKCQGPLIPHLSCVFIG